LCGVISTPKTISVPVALSGDVLAVLTIMILTSGNSQEDTMRNSKRTIFVTRTIVARLKIIKITYIMHHHAC
jgi:hypothetical protein